MRHRRSRTAGLAPPRFEEIALRFRVTISITRVAPTKVDGPDTAIMIVLLDNKGRATLQIAAAIGLTIRATRTRLARVVEQGLIREIGTGPQDPRRVHVRVP